MKVYLIDGKTCVEKQKTVVARRTSDPLYQQQLVFNEPYLGKILQVCISRTALCVYIISPIIKLLESFLWALFDRSYLCKKKSQVVYWLCHIIGSSLGLRSIAMERLLQLILPVQLVMFKLQHVYCLFIMPPP